MKTEGERQQSNAAYSVPPKSQNCLDTSSRFCVCLGASRGSCTDRHAIKKSARNTADNSRSVAAIVLLRYRVLSWLPLYSHSLRYATLRRVFDLRNPCCVLCCVSAAAATTDSQYSRQSDAGPYGAVVVAGCSAWWWQGLRRTPIIYHLFSLVNVLRPSRTLRGISVLDADSNFLV